MPPTDEDGWDAHHVIPKGAKQAAVKAQAIAYRCQIHPNSNWNGVFLRHRFGGPLRTGTEQFKRLQERHPELAARAMHWDYRPSYDDAVSQVMSSKAATSSGQCRGKMTAQHALRDNVTNQLVKGHVPGIGDAR